jgi:hypothetical protein
LREVPLEVAAGRPEHSTSCNISRAEPGSSRGDTAGDLTAQDGDDGTGAFLVSLPTANGMRNHETP